MSFFAEPEQCLQVIRQLGYVMLSKETKLTHTYRKYKHSPSKDVTGVLSLSPFPSLPTAFSLQTWHEGQTPNLCRVHVQVYWAENHEGIALTKVLQSNCFYDCKDVCTEVTTKKRSLKTNTVCEKR